MQRLAAATMALALALPLDARAADRRWPAWPTEVDRAAAPLSVTRPVGSADEGDRAAAVRALERFATQVIAEPVAKALEDPSAAVRREALRVCFERRLLSCIPSAATLWSKGHESTLRVAALRVLAMDPDPSRVALILGALREPSDEMRAQAAQFLGWAPLRGEPRRQARAALLAKMGDSSAVVRRRAVESLGLLGGGDGTLAIARLLSDPEPSVRAAAAVALGRWRDPRAVPALLRAAEGQNESIVARAIVGALARLPEPERAQGESTTVAAALLSLLDDPPAGLTAFQLAEALGARPSPEPALIEGLIERIREPPLRTAALRALLLVGEPARGPLIAARRRGLEPPLDLEAARLLAALEPVDTVDAMQTAPQWPASKDFAGWSGRLAVGDRLDRSAAAVELAQRSPPWLGPVLTARLEDEGPIQTRRAWMLAMARASAELDVGSGTAHAWARLIGWASDAALATEDRCLAMAALGTASRRADQRATTATLRDLSGDREPDVRACAAAALSRGDASAGRHLALMLLDPSARVRAAAALALAEVKRQPRAAGSRLAVLRALDPSHQVRAAADRALRRITSPGPRNPRPTFVAAGPPSITWASPQTWAELEVGGRSVWVPLVGSGRHRWALVPGLDDATVVALHQP